MGKITLESKEYEEMFQKATGAMLLVDYVNNTDVVDKEMCGLLLGFKVEEVERVENKMVVDSLWNGKTSEEAEEKVNGAGYRQMGTEIFVPAEDAFDYAICQCVEMPPEGFLKIKWTEEFKENLVEWFYSDNWIWEE